MDAPGNQSSDYVPDCKYCLQRLNANRVVPNIILPPDYEKILGHKPSTAEFDIKQCPYCGKMVLGTVLLEHQLRCVYDLHEPDTYMCDACRASGFMEFHTEEEQVEMAMELSEFQERRKKFVELLHEVPVTNNFGESSALPKKKRNIDEVDDAENNEDLPHLPSKKAKIGKPQCTRKRDESGRFIREGPVPKPTKKGNNKRPTEVEKLTSSSWFGVGSDPNTLVNEPSLTRRGTDFRKSSKNEGEFSRFS